MIRVLVVEDSPTVRARLVEVLAAAEGITIAGEAQDGRQAIEMCRSLRPDIVTLDMMLPVMSGLAATEFIMAHFPTPILIVSASTNRGELFKTYDALAAGAVDVLEKPRGTETDKAWEHRFVAAVKLVSRIKVITHPRARLVHLGRPASIATSPPSILAKTRRTGRAIAIGASTGGPGAIVEVLRALPAPSPVPLFFVLHLGDPFGHAFADWLDGQTAHRARYAIHGEAIPGGGAVLMAPPDQHLIVREGRLFLTKDPERHSCRPSVDVLFESVARQYGSLSAAALLTGMGHDGAAGLLEVRRAGGLTVAQDETTSVVYGMPREAMLLGAAEHVLALGDIGPALAAATVRAGSAA
jgi:two-component system chemotaxis response regulator CheB